jgi:hypothetical protein
VENSLWKRLWTCRKTDCGMICLFTTFTSKQMSWLHDGLQHSITSNVYIYLYLRHYALILLNLPEKNLCKTGTCSVAEHQTARLQPRQNTIWCNRLSNSQLDIDDQPTFVCYHNGGWFNGMSLYCFPLIYLNIVLFFRSNKRSWNASLSVCPCICPVSFVPSYIV